MAMSCHGKGPVPKKVACEFNRHDRGTGMLNHSNRSRRIRAKGGRI
jgi:hypothetical protein